MYIKFYWKTPKRRDHLEETDTDGKLTLTGILQ
jgi:hypothetical protein